MNAEMWLTVLLFVGAGITFWFVDWKNKIEDSHRVKYSEFLKYKQETDVCKTELIERIHQAELQLATRLTREEVAEFKLEIKNDFLEMKKEFREMIKEIKPG